MSARARAALRSGRARRLHPHRRRHRASPRIPSTSASETIGLDPGLRLSVDETMLVEGTDRLYVVGDAPYSSRALGTVRRTAADGWGCCPAPWDSHRLASTRPLHISEWPRPTSSGRGRRVFLPTAV
ncbi:hypothetical protein E1269_09140 [Jiangella asiatica]|uniref:Uncharacterized protein n=1 Tax=Jiangella asiatica TaxID=2530372 RepID=A0A4R5DKR4_9ACTN|nr:hypothetical protein E1269_09140 [Jiangella asiatica]